MSELKRFGLTRKPENYAFFDPESKLHLTLAKPVGTTSRVTAGIERALKTGKIMDMDTKKQTPGVVLADPMNAIRRTEVLNTKDSLPPVDTTSQNEGTGVDDPNEEGTTAEDTSESKEAEVVDELTTATEEKIEDVVETAEAVKEEASAPLMKYDAESLTDDYNKLKALAKEEGINEKAKAKIVEHLLKIEA